MVNGGSVISTDGELKVSNVYDVTLPIVGATSYNSATDISGDAVALAISERLRKSWVSNGK